MKKAQGLSVTTIVIVAIALVVLVVLISVFTGQFGLFAGDVKKTGDATIQCASQKFGTPLAAARESDGACNAGETIIAAQTSAGKICCAKV